ncbi:MAG TPA: LuxR C-terminal-related transcriptional regulator [Propionibacteriaceae bacterium]|nr:LuxR C-terminal-related transcriptional regulator [Propionibacteriaceae bacterium]
MTSVSGDARQRASDKLARLAGQGLDLVSFWRASTEALTSAVPHYWAPCWFTLDPASLLVTSHFDESIPELPPQWLLAEYYQDDVNKLADVARSRRGVSTLHEATGGDPSSSPRWHFNMTLGGDQELIAGLRTPAGEVWGALGLYREPGRPLFDDTELAFVQSLAPSLAEGARRALLVGEATDPEGPNAPGLLVLSDDGEVESATPGVERWLAALPDGDPQAGKLPSAVLAVAGQALRTAEHPDQPGEVAVSRVLSRSGTWVLLHGASLVSGGPRRVAVIVEPAHPARIAPLLMSAYGLTEREQEVTRLVLQGSSTAEIAQRLVVSAHTVQQHLKSVFDKTGVRSRRDLVGKVFFAHYEPRLRDNERRASADQPLRGGPLPLDHGATA